MVMITVLFAVFCRKKLHFLGSKSKFTNLQFVPQKFIKLRDFERFEGLKFAEPAAAVKIVEHGTNYRYINFMVI